MKTYKAPDNSLHSIAPEFCHMLPAGCIEITDAEADAIRAALIPKPTQSELIAKTIADAKIQRLPIMNVLDGLQTSAIVTGDMPTAQAIETSKQGLRNITNIDLTPYTTEDQMRQAVYAAYRALAAAAPASVQSAFASMVPA